MNLKEISTLSVPERILLVEQIWDSIAEDVNKQPLEEWKKELLEKRLSDHKPNPGEGISWQELKAKY
jgi:putative addiction module component (TIGR02574 family)